MLILVMIVENKVIHIDESNLENTVNLLGEQFDCTIEGNHLSVKGDGIRASAYLYNEFDGISMSINSVSFENDYTITSQQNDGVIVARFMYNSVWEINNESIGNEVDEGVIIFRSNLPFTKVIKSNTKQKWITLRTSIDFYNKLSRGEIQGIKDFVLNESSWIMYEAVTPDIHHSMSELFSIGDLNILGNRIKSVSLGFKLLSLIAPRFTKRGQDSSSFGLLAIDSDIMFKIKEDILHDLSISPDIDKLAEKYAISSSKLRSNFKKMYGMPIIKFLMQERFHKAYRLIERTEDSIKSIAYDTGFANVTHFSKGFKDLFGITPTQLRK